MRLEEIVTDFLLPLRLGKDIRLVSFENFIDNIYKFIVSHPNNNFSTEEIIILLEVYPQLIGCSSNYIKEDHDLICDWADDFIEILKEYLLKNRTQEK